MQFTYAAVAAATLALANAVSLTNTPQSFVGVTAGKALNISWTDASGPVTLTLKNGVSTALNTVEVIASGLAGTSYVWTPSTSLPVDTYALQIDDSTAIPNYSVQFEITGGAASSSASSASSSASASATVSSSSNSTSTASGSSSSASATTGSNSTTTASSSASKTSSGSSTSKTGTSTSASATGSASAPPNTTGAGSSIASPLAFVLLAFAALMTLN